MVLRRRHVRRGLPARRVAHDACSFDASWPGWTRCSTPCQQRGLHLSLNLYPAPGYIITGWETEPHNLWARDAFVATWQRFARRYAGVSSAALSFDLVNEPPALGLRGFTWAAHEGVIRPTVAAIQAITPQRPLVIDGLDGGNLAMPELADLSSSGSMTQSVRGYQPMSVSHYQAPRWPGHRELGAAEYPCSCSCTASYPRPASDGMRRRRRDEIS
jgi:endoglucanase